MSGHGVGVCAHPPGVSDGPFQELLRCVVPAGCPRLYFLDSFLSAPPKWCEVCLPSEPDAHAWLSTMDEWNDPQHHAAIAIAYRAIQDDCGYGGWFLWPKGTKITHRFPHHPTAIWVLTGRYFPLDTEHRLRGKVAGLSDNSAMKCLNCGHEASQHNLATNLACRVRTLSGWSEDEGQHTQFRGCGCQRYRGVYPDHACPHEFLPKGGCVHCGTARVEH